jgi:hypothetical protein
MFDQGNAWPVGAGRLTDPVLGQEGNVTKMGSVFWASFRKKFPPTGSDVTVLVNVFENCVPSSQIGLYREIEEKYPKLVLEIAKALNSKISSAGGVFQKRFELDVIDLRGHVRPSMCVLLYRTDHSDLEFDWYVRLAKDGRVELVGERD